MAIRDFYRDPPKKFPMFDPKTGLVSLPWSEWLSMLQKANAIFDVEGPYEPPSIPAGGTHQVSISSPNARPGHFAAASFSAMQSGMTLTAWATTGAVIVTFHNVSTGAINMPSGTLRVRYWRNDV